MTTKPQILSRVALGAGTRQALLNSIRTTVVTVVSLITAQSLKLPESYWAPISSTVVLLSTIQPLTLAWQRFVGTALGALLGGLTASYLSAGWITYGAGVFFCGILCAALRLTGAYRFTAITFTIVLLARHGRPPWIVASHRFIEVSLGIAVALIGTLVWPLEQGTVDEAPSASGEGVRP